jgi:hypothetical protein
LLLLLGAFFLANILCIPWNFVIIKDGILISAPLSTKDCFVKFIHAPLISSFPISVVTCMAHAHRVDGMASCPWSSSLC